MKSYGKVDITLDKYLKAHKISRSSLVRNTGLQYSQVLKYCRNDIQKMDLHILAKLCTVLDCDIEDLLKLTKGKIDR
ncbi:MAG: helix-turn-helix domain-containing protein [Clostridia bacterium]|jgi:putative transcriptional regulator